MLKSKKILVTAGPTHEYLDDIRFIGNRSSGKQGVEIAKCLQKLEGDVTLVIGPVNLELAGLIQEQLSRYMKLAHIFEL